jgi:GNAT superfamily N-acetyltransferase
MASQTDETMDVTRQYIDVRMIREDLDDVPECPLPAGYSIRRYQPGDENMWHEIQSLADEYNKVTPSLFEEEFGTDARVLAERQCFLCDSHHNAIGTASAWFGDHEGQYRGRIHWVAIAPQFRGRGLAKPLLAETCNRLRTLGHSKTYLTTQTCRIPAINLYAKFGFSPAIESRRDREIWRELERRVKYPLRF